MEKLLPRFDVLGVEISALDLATASRLIIQAANEKRKSYVTFTGVHGVVESQDDPELRCILNESFLTGADGMPLVWLGKRQAGPHVGRVYGPDAMLAICAETAATGQRHFLYGGGEGVAIDLAEKLQARFPALNVVGTFTPPFRPLNAEEEQALIEQVGAVKPDFFWVGISTPKQEKFMAEWLSRLDATVMLGVGAAFDFHSGRKPQAPCWMQRSGLEWLYRMITEPRRLGGRYLRNNTRFLWLLARQILTRH
ncbi:WecB/TagA/CpsF family glycosyltransferase [Cerasicoccus arenae]|uniref:Glycosyl transferase n=1 Tax=Cerasicoccus arenae TaxID=424488 RepID=A0A8J3D9L9_9BACT|nr:WecB/TagA/CpsF family glycosyltransferase [Cerasicoccus arenae]MBK1859320.1 WecB/TagA/CpsF family glycosyltransferase [Cerasicoccus arenae]GHB93950.1 glycosyl transferase [Cerasicoccus arenae]